MLKLYKKMINLLKFLFYYVEFDDAECYNYIDNLGKLCPIANLNFLYGGNFQWQELKKPWMVTVQPLM